MVSQVATFHLTAIIFCHPKEIHSTLIPPLPSPYLIHLHAFLLYKGLSSGSHTVLIPHTFWFLRLLHIFDPTLNSATLAFWHPRVNRWTLMV